MPEASKTSVSIVMPVYREAANLSTVLKDVAAACDEADVSYELVLIDDGSPDETWQLIKEQSAIYPTLRAARLSRNFGKEYALTAGIEMATGDAVIVMDADGQHPPSLIPTLIGTWRNTDTDIVDAVKSNRGKETILNKLSANLFYSLWSSLSGFELKGASDYKLLDRRAVDAYHLMYERNVFFRGMASWVGFKRVQVPFEVVERSKGASSWSVLRLLRLALTGLTAFSSLPLHLVTLSGIVFLLFAFLFGIQTLYVYLSGRTVTGFATVIFLLLIIGSFLMISLGIIGEYIARIYDEVKGRPRFIIRDRVGPSETIAEIKQTH